MAINKNIVLLVASYDSKEAAEQDLSVLNGMSQQDILDDVAIALIYKENGKIKHHQETNAGKALATVGAVGGMIIGAIFPPAGLAVFGGAVAGAAAFGLIAGGIGHFAGGVSRKDLKAIGEALEENEAAILVVAEDEALDAAEHAMDRAAKKAKHSLDKGDVDAAVADVEAGLVKANEDLAS